MTDKNESVSVKEETKASASDPLHALVREAFDESKPAKLALLPASLASNETNDDEMTRLLELLVSDAEATKMRRKSNQKRVLDLILKSKWSHRGK